MEMPLSELIDRYTILKLKSERTDQDVSTHLEQYKREIPENLNSYVDRLYEINGKCWDLEAAIRQGKEEELGLEEVGRRTLILRDMNKIRVKIKNDITEITKDGPVEIKNNHASETKWMRL